MKREQSRKENEKSEKFSTPEKKEGSRLNKLLEEIIFDLSPSEATPDKPTPSDKAPAAPTQVITTKEKHVLHLNGDKHGGRHSDRHVIDT